MQRFEPDCEVGSPAEGSEKLKEKVTQCFNVKYNFNKDTTTQPLRNILGALPNFHILNEQNRCVQLDIRVEKQERPKAGGMVVKDWWTVIIDADRAGPDANNNDKPAHYGYTVDSKSQSSKYCAPSCSISAAR